MSNQNDVEDLAETVGTFAKVFAKRIVRHLSTAIEDVDRWSSTEPANKPEAGDAQQSQANAAEAIDTQNVAVVASLMRKSFSPELLERARGGGLIIKITPHLRDELQSLAAQGDDISKRIIYYAACTEK